jgi:peptidoglycan/xylan/chitin deacetylase (PgdA/CDA1 family)
MKTVSTNHRPSAKNPEPRIYSRRQFISVGAGIVMTSPSVPSLVEELTSLLGPDTDHVAPHRGEILPPSIHDLRKDRGPESWGSQHPLFLTFDDGPLFCTAQILEHLTQRKHKATFFVIGRNLVNPKLRELAIRALQEGHDIGNHSYDHPNFSTISIKRAEREIVSTHELIQAIVKESGVNPRRQDLFFRFPYGVAGSRSNWEHCQGVLADLNYRIAWWDLDTNDWRMELPWFPRPSSRVIRSLNKARPNDVILLHDRAKTAEYLPRMLEILESQRLFSVALSTYERIEDSSILAHHEHF